MDFDKLIKVMSQETAYSRNLRLLSEKQNRFWDLSDKFEKIGNLKKSRYYLTLSNKYFDRKMDLMDERFGW